MLKIKFYETQNGKEPVREIEKALKYKMDFERRHKND